MFPDGRSGPCFEDWRKADEAMAVRLRAQLERGEVTMAGITADHVRYCGQDWTRIEGMGREMNLS